MPDGGALTAMETFTPGPETARSFRNALGQFATGVTVVTCQGRHGPMGITANSFASLSLDPPLVLWSPARASRRFPHYEDALHYAIHVLAAEQADVAHAFSRDGEAFHAVGWTPNDHGVPLLDGCLARFECHREAVHDGGDHLIVVGRVLRASWRAGEPLVFAGGAYGRFTDAA
jgi:flavin reductase (DIM6/NTAB) family NADH-FMN oxidoreductase RutF